MHLRSKVDQRKEYECHIAISCLEIGCNLLLNALSAKLASRKVGTLRKSGCQSSPGPRRADGCNAERNRRTALDTFACRTSHGIASTSATAGVPVRPGSEKRLVIGASTCESNGDDTPHAPFQKVYRASKQQCRLRPVRMTNQRPQFS